MFYLIKVVRYETYSEQCFGTSKHHVLHCVRALRNTLFSILQSFSMPAREILMYNFGTWQMA